MAATKIAAIAAPTTETRTVSDPTNPAEAVGAAMAAIPVDAC